MFSYSSNNISLHLYTISLLVLNHTFFKQTITSN